MPFENGQDFDRARSHTVDQSVVADEKFPENESAASLALPDLVRVPRERVPPLNEFVDELGCGGRVVPRDESLDLGESKPWPARSRGPSSAATLGAVDSKTTAKFDGIDHPA